MTYVLLGAVSFVFFYLFDVFNIKGKSLLKVSFAIIGLITFIYSSYKIAFLGSNVSFHKGIRLISALLFLISLFLLFYSLFLELPFKKTYGGKDYNNGLITTGTYALCRHPGVLWFFFMFIFLFFYTGSTLLLMAGLIWTSLDVLYVYLQEKYFFQDMFKDYKKYKKTTPMLIPNLESIKRCFKTIK